MIVIIYTLVVIGLFIIYRRFFTRKYYLRIGANRKYRLYSKHFEVNVDGHNYEFENSGSKWIINSNEEKMNVGIQEIFKLANNDALIVDNSNVFKHQKIASFLFSLIISCPLVIGIILIINSMIPSDEYGKKDIIAFITDGTTNYNMYYVDEDYQSGDVLATTDERFLSVRTDDIYLTACSSDTYELFVSEDVVWHDENNNDITANKLIGETLCLSFDGKNGEKCYFIGQYNDNYKWDGECTICAYVDGVLYYVTEDYYENNTLVSYKRISSHNNRWIYTDKTIDANGNTFGDTWSYDYIIFSEKQHNSELPNKSDFYFISEVRELLDNSLICHYRGAYDSNQSWFDSSGEAYVILYEDGKVEELYKGTVLDSSYGEGLCIRLQDDNTFLVMKGIFHDREGKEVNELTYDTVSKEDIFKYIKNQKYEEEINNVGWNYID